jgi:hypothetical protein
MFTLRIMLRYKRHKAKQLTISSRVPVHTKQQVGYLRANLSLTNIILFKTLSHTHTVQNSSFYTTSQANSRRITQQQTSPTNRSKQLAAAAPRHLLFYGCVHRATNTRETDSTNTTTATLVPA